MQLAMGLVFVLGYVLIAMEHKLRVNKAATALVMGAVLWVLYVSVAKEYIPAVNAEAFGNFLNGSHFPEGMAAGDKALEFLTKIQLPEILGDISSTLFFLLGAMTIVEIIDVHGGFAIITNRVKTTNKTKLLWIIAGLTFFMSSVLDNMTTAIVMIMMVRRLISNYKERWIFAGIIIIAANSGGAWSPIGDITTILLWMNDNITTGHIITSLFLPCLVSLVVPVLLASRLLKGVVAQRREEDERDGIDEVVTKTERMSIFVLGVACLLFVPVFKTVTHLPPYMGMLLSLGIMWVYTEIMYDGKRSIQERLKHRVPRVIRNIDVPTILFFLGLLLSVKALEQIGLLTEAAGMLESKFGNVYAINTVIGLLSSVIDNVPLVAAAISMYPVATEVSVAAAANPEFVSQFVTDGTFWNLLAYCAGTGGSVLIIGSVAGVVVMGIEKISFTWYLKYISYMALAGYFAGILTFMGQHYLLNGAL